MSTAIDPAIVERIAAVIRDTVAEDWIWEITIDSDTRFNDDLELESIEFVAIAAGLQEHFGARVDLIDWLSTRGFHELNTLRVGDIARFVASTLEKSEA